MIGITKPSSSPFRTLGQWFGSTLLRDRHDQSAADRGSDQKAIDESRIKDKPVTVSFVGGERSDKAISWLVENGIPAYGAPDLAVNAMAAMREYTRLREW